MELVHNILKRRMVEAHVMQDAQDMSAIKIRYILLSKGLMRSNNVEQLLKSLINCTVAMV